MNRFVAFALLCCLVACRPASRIQAGSNSLTLSNDGKLWASLFQQRAAEYRALCQQAYNIARLRIDESLAETSSKPRAIITDIDETFLDNSPYAVQQALKGKEYDARTWAEWTARGIADTLQGSVALFNYAASHNIEVFYITNREETERAGTLENLKRFNLPFADNAHLVMRKDVSSKEARRQVVATTHQIIFLLGDNLADFSSLFDKKTEGERLSNTWLTKDEFGKRFIVLPNTTYGGWEEALYQYNFNRPAAQKDSLVKALLK